uniref:Uncharacterized protein n=1 Tax=Arundo donax TaxID=35708 RepID=A0A0A9CA70_ARUDO
MRVATTHKNDNKAIVTSGVIISSKRPLIFLLVADVLGHIGNANMEIC